MRFLRSERSGFNHDAADQIADDEVDDLTNFTDKFTTTSATHLREHQVSRQNLGSPGRLALLS
jgi:hypothetical protein